MNGFKKMLLVPHIKVHNANALSSPYTIGFPAMTAWLGAVHAMQRKLVGADMNVQFGGVGVICHELDLQTYKGGNDFVHSIVGTGNPLDKTGQRSSFIEEARCHLDVSLVIECEGLDVDSQESCITLLSRLLHSRMKMAGGDIQSFNTLHFLVCEEGNDKDLIKLKHALMPGYALIERRELMVDAMGQGADALEALIDYLAIHNHCDVISKEGDNGDIEETINWTRQRKTFNNKSIGWVVPIATGFQGVSPLGQAKNQRDPDTPHRFAESIVTLGEFKMTHRIKRVEELFWRYQQEGDLYLCHQSSHQHLSSSIEEEEFSEFE